MNSSNKINNILLNSKSVFGIAISVIAIFFAFKDFKYAEFKEIVSEIKIFYVLLATIFLWMSVFFRGIRWRYLFKQNLSPSVNSLYRAEMIGYFGNNVLPLRLGEVLRSFIISKEWNLSKSFVLGTVVVERILDTISLSLLSLLLVYIYPLDPNIKNNIIYFSISLLLLLFLILILLQILRKLGLNNKYFIWMKKIVNGLSFIDKKSIIYIVLTSFIIWGIYFLDAYLLQLAFSFELSFSQVLLLLVLSSMAMAIPSAPAMIGTYHYAVKYIMVDLLGYSVSNGNAFAIIIHGYAFILFTLIGAYYFIQNQFSRLVFTSVIKEEVKN